VFAPNDRAEVRQIHSENAGRDGIVLKGLEYTAKALQGRPNGSGRYGLYIPGANIRAENLEFDMTGRGQDCIFIEGNDNQIVSPIEAERAGRHGINLFKSKKTSILGGRSVDHQQHGVQMPDDKTRKILIDNMTFAENRAADIHVEGPDHEIRECDFIKGSNTPVRIEIGSSTQRLLTRNNTFDTSNGTPRYSVDSNAIDIYLADPNPEARNINGELGANPSSSTYTATFDCKFSHKPRMDVLPDGAEFQFILLTSVTPNLLPSNQGFISPHRFSNFSLQTEARSNNLFLKK